MHPPKSIGLSIKYLCNQIKRTLDEGNTDGLTNITGMQGFIIAYLYHNAGKQDIFQRDLENEFNIRRSTVTGVLQLMEKNGLIIRAAVDHDARLKKLSLTDKAIAAHQQFIARITALEAQMTAGLSQEELDAFYATLAKISNNLQ